MDEAGLAALRLALGRGDGAGVWPQNAAIVTAFLLVASQWRTGLRITDAGVRTVFIGLDYAAARAGLDALGVAVTPALFAGVMVMEMAAAKALNGERT